MFYAGGVDSQGPHPLKKAIQFSWDPSLRALMRTVAPKPQGLMGAMDEFEFP